MARAPLRGRAAAAPRARRAVRRVRDPAHRPGRIELLDHADAAAYIDVVRDRTLAAIETRGTDRVLHEMVLRHELQHTETMRQAMDLAGPAPARRAAAARVRRRRDAWLTVPAGPSRMGSAEGRFAYDNERPLHAVDAGAS